MELHHPTKWSFSFVTVPKRLNSFIDKTRRNKLIMGYGGIEKYYG